jgi:hypothetical protein
VIVHSRPVDLSTERTVILTGLALTWGGLAVGTQMVVQTESLLYAGWMFPVAAAFIGVLWVFSAVTQEHSIVQWALMTTTMFALVRFVDFAVSWRWGNLGGSTGHLLTAMGAWSSTFWLSGWMAVELGRGRLLRDEIAELR